jgi:hypothetical protein
MLFRHHLTQDYSTGARGKNISKRSLNRVDGKLSPILLVDCTYIAYLLESRHNSKRSNIYNKLDSKLLDNLTTSSKLTITEKSDIYKVRDVVLTLVSNTIRLIHPDNIILVYNSAENLLTNEYSEQIVAEILKPLNWTSVFLKQGRYSDYIFSFLQKHSADLSGNLLVYLTNSITTWACCSSTLQHGMITFTRNMRPIFYSDKTGLDILSKFINTSKIINKLGLDDVKYVNLQYLYIIMLYIKFLQHNEKDSTYFFDAKYFKQEKGVEYYDFLRSKGSGLDMIADAHKTLSYIFLTKSDLMDQFLFFTTHNFILNLKRLIKITDFDKALMSYLSNYYILSDRLTDLTIQQVTFLSNDLLCNRTKQGITKVVFFPDQYDKLLSALKSKTYTQKKPEKLFEVSIASDDKGVEEYVSKILRELLW